MRRIVTGFTAMLFLAIPAWADAIDGSWCSDKGLHVSIDGPEIVTPAGAKVTGKYQRHAFAYVAPAGEADASRVIFMQLLDEAHMQSFLIKDDKVDIETKVDWQRCQITS